MRAKKSLGQNFLQDVGVIERIVDALDLALNDTVIEIGPGRGALTEMLLPRAGKVIAIEFDRDMVAFLRQRFGGSGLELVEGDVLDIDLGELVSGTAKLVGNLPYNISTPILQRLIECRESFSTIVLMFQREVVDRITATPGGRDRGFLSVLVEDAFITESLFDVPPTAFQPAPKVWSSVIKLTPKRSCVADMQVFRNVVSASFAQKRKTILNNLKNIFPDAATRLHAADIDGGRRAETLSLDEWLRLTDQIKQ